MEELKTRIVEQCQQCGQCQAHCQFLKTYGDPKDIALRFHPEKDAAQPLPFLCHLCGLCDAVCPAKLEPSRFFLELRRQCVAAGGAPLPQHRRILAYEKRGLSPRHTLRLIPPGCRTVFFPGCALATTRPRQVLAVYHRIKEKLPGLGLVLDCCTRISHDLGRERFFRKALGELTSFLIEHGIKQVITACPGCHDIFRRYGEGISTRMVYEVLEDQEIGGPSLSQPVTVQVHDCCVNRFDTHIQRAVRGLLSRQGIRVQELPHWGTLTYCCGEGGQVGYVRPEFSRAWARKRMAEAKHPVVTPCAGCVQSLSSLGQVTHVLDLWLDPERALQGKSSRLHWPLTSWNRLRLKQALKRLPGPALSCPRPHPIE